MNTNINNYRTELCTAPSGRYYVEVYELTSDERVHTTARREDEATAVALATDWIGRETARQYREYCESQDAA